MSLYGRQNAEQGSDTNIVVPQALSRYLHLSIEQAAALKNTLEKYKKLVESKRADQRSAQMRAAVDPSLNANRSIEQDQIEIQKARTETRACIAEILSSDQLSQLKQLAVEQPWSDEQRRLAEQAASLNLIRPHSMSGKQPFGGTVPIFAADTASQPDLDQPAVPKKPLAKRPPPTSPPQ